MEKPDRWLGSPVFLSGSKPSWWLRLVCPPFFVGSNDWWRAPIFFDPFIWSKSFTWLGFCNIPKEFWKFSALLPPLTPICSAEVYPCIASIKPPYSVRLLLWTGSLDSPWERFPLSWIPPDGIWANSSSISPLRYLSSMFLLDLDPGFPPRFLLA